MADATVDIDQQIKSDTTQFKTIMSEAMSDTGTFGVFETLDNAESVTEMIRVIERNISRSDMLLDEIAYGQQRLVGEHERMIQRLRYELQEKERVIQFLKPFRLSSPHYWFVWFTSHLAPRLPLLHKIYYKLIVTTRNRFKPRLGEFYHYAPRPMYLPARYYNTKLQARTAPKISIVTPSFNQGNFIGRTIGSVINQGYPNLQYIIQDGGSTDDTWRIVEGVRSKLAFSEFRADRGQSHGINLGFTKSDGDIMAYLNSDDLLLPGSLNYVANYFAKHPNVDAVYGHRVIIDEHDNEIGRWVLPPHNNGILKWVDYIPQETLFWRRSLWESIDGRIDESFRFAMDWDLLLRFQEAGAKIVRLPRFLGAFRVHAQQKTSTQINEVGYREMWRLRERSLGRRPSFEELNQAIRGYMLQHIMYQKLYRLGLVRY
jgi:glycosyltransferase involved in cell wall biosynthesis